MKKIFILILLISFNSFCQITNNQDEDSANNGEKISYVDFNISLIRLIATPERYDGKVIQVEGFLNLEFEGNAIYLHKEDYENSLCENGFWVNFSDEIKLTKKTIDYNKKYVIIIGTFDMKSNGHMGLFGGTIKNITRLDVLKN